MATDLDMRLDGLEPLAIGDAILVWLREMEGRTEAIVAHPLTESVDYFRGQAFAYRKAAEAVELALTKAPSRA